MADDAQWLGQIEAVVLPVLASRGMSLVDSEWQREGRRWVLRLFVDKPGGVGIADCQAFSREAGDVLDVSGLIEPSYDLEVSSPGLDRVLKKDRELRWAIGRDVHCWVSEPVDGRMEFSGRLAEVSTAVLMLEEMPGARREIPRRLVTKVKLELTAFGRAKR
ncbi:MAG TPA: ribosome maturation factor RimP [Methylomirabilota bacterium]|nr:ribosome maturation factor RimP [Methylomirabilota bacterium]